MENKSRKSLMLFIIALFIQSCISGARTNYTPYWEPPMISHSLLFSQSKFAQVKWEQQAYILSNSFRTVQCVATAGVIVLVGSQDVTVRPKIFALDGKTGALLWDFDSAGVLAYSDDGLFIGEETKVYLVDPRTGLVRNITGMMYYDKLLFINGTGIYSFYVIGNDGQTISKHTQPLDFHSTYKKVPFYPDLPFGYAVSDDIFVEQRGNILYSGYVIDRLTNELLWHVDQDSISNFVILNNFVYWVSSDDQVKIANKHSGNLIETIKIAPSIEFFDANIAKQHAGYYLCGDNEMGFIYLILGDSRQLFAIEIRNQ
jgi:hypothetical protein